MHILKIIINWWQITKRYLTTTLLQILSWWDLCGWNAMVLTSSWTFLVELLHSTTMEPRHNKTLYHKVLSITKWWFLSAPVIVKYMEKNLNMMKSCYSKHIFAVPWPFVISRFLCICFERLNKQEFHVVVSLFFHWPLLHDVGVKRL